MPDATFTDVACTVCGCVCDDLSVTVEDGRVTRADGACDLARPWFLAQSSGGEHNPAAFAADLDRAAAILSAARAPLIYGLSRSTTDGQRAAVALADRLGATVDTTASTGHAPSIMALQQVGESTCTLGEVRQRADLVVFWGSDPDTTHPRHRERYCPPGAFTVVVDVTETRTAAAAGLFVRLDPGTDWDALTALRLLTRGPSGLARSSPSLNGGVLQVEAAPGLRALADRLLAARFAVVFFGAGLTGNTPPFDDGDQRARSAAPLAHKSVEALLQLTSGLNAPGRRSYARRMRRFGDVAGADSVLTWQTGYPFGVNLAAGYPRYNPGEFTAPDLLARGDVDAVVVIGADTLAGFPPAAAAALAKLPVILLDPGGGSVVDFTPAVRFTTAVYGVHRPGTAYRLDEVPIPLRVLLPTELPTDAAVLGGILSRLALLPS